MQHNIQQVNLNRHIPVNIQLWAGSFELHTHPELSIKIDADGIGNTDLVPEISFKENSVEISGQSLSALLVRSDAVVIKIYVPDESIVTLRQATGSTVVSGSYKKLKVKNWLGNVHAHLDHLFVKEHADLKVISGDVYVDADDQSIIKSRSGYENYQFFRFYNNSTIKASAYIGEVKWKVNFNDRYFRFA